MQMPFLTPAQLAARWNMSTITLAQWRWSGIGPEYHKIGGRISYSLEAAIEFENSKRCRCTTGYPFKQPIRSDLKKSDEKAQLKYIHLVKKGAN